MPAAEDVFIIVIVLQMVFSGLYWMAWCLIADARTDRANKKGENYDGRDDPAIRCLNRVHHISVWITGGAGVICLFTFLMT